MRLGIRGESGPLALRLAWLSALRLFVVTVVLVVTTVVYMRSLAPGGPSTRIALFTIVSAYILTGAYALALRFGRKLERLAGVQIVTDQIAWTAIVYITGGAASGATSLYGLTCLSGAILLGVRGALLAAGTGGALYVGLAVALTQRLLPPPEDQSPEPYLLRWVDLGYPLFVNLLGLVVVTALAGYLAERLRTTGGHLAVANARVEEAERLASLGRLAAGLAHEIRNPLGSIAGSIELLRTGGGLSEEDRRLCMIIERETSRLNELVTDMLELSRPRVPVKAPVDLASMTRDVVLLAGTSGRGSDVKVRYEGPAVAIVQADASQMRQVVWNLVRNAVQVSSAGDEVIVAISPELDGGVALAVTDHGPGIGEEARERLFDAFFTTRSQGVGVGLAVVKRIVDDHGFAVEVESEEGKGASFRIRIPLADPAAVAAALVPSPIRASTRPRLALDATPADTAVEIPKPPAIPTRIG